MNPQKDYAPPAEGAFVRLISEGNRKEQIRLPRGYKIKKDAEFTYLTKPDGRVETFSHDASYRIIFDAIDKDMQNRFTPIDAQNAPKERYVTLGSERIFLPPDMNFRTCRNTSMTDTTVPYDDIYYTLSITDGEISEVVGKWHVSDLESTIENSEIEKAERVLYTARVYQFLQSLEGFSREQIFPRRRTWHERRIR